MKSITEHIRNHIYELHSMVIQSMPETVKFTCIFSNTFMKLMIHRLVIGSYRYGRKDSPIVKNYDYISSIESRLKKYKEDGNLEYMVDIANLCLLEFKVGQHPKRHFKAIDDGEHAEEI